MDEDQLFRAIQNHDAILSTLGEVIIGVRHVHCRIGLAQVFLPAELPDRDSLLRQREDRAGRGDAAQYVLAKRDQRRCGLGSDRA